MCMKSCGVCVCDELDCVYNVCVMSWVVCVYVVFVCIAGAVWLICFLFYT